MASLKKRKGTAVWLAQFYVKDPTTGELRQVRRSTGQRNRKKAMAAAIDMERNAQGVMAAGSDRAQRAKAILAEACAEIDRETFTQVSARKYLGQLVKLVTGEEMQSFSVETWIAEWIRRKSRDSSKSTIARYQGHANSFLEWLGNERAKKPLESVTTQEARLWVESILDTGVVGKTAQSYAKDLGSVYRSAIREGLVAFNPFTALDTIDTSDSHERKPFTTSEVVALMQAAPTWEWRGLILAAAFTGLRLGDCARLLWDKIDLDAKLISLIPSKTRKKKRVVKIPIQSELLQFFKSAPSHGEGLFVFPELSNLAVGARNGLSLEFVRIMEIAGVDRGKPSRVLEEGESKGKGRITYERGFHSFRHTFTAWLRKAGVPEEDRMALTGHSTRESHAIYSHEDEKALRKAISKLPSLKS
jgi:integrase